MAQMNFPRHESGPYRGRYLDPEGHLTGSFQQLMEAGCLQAENRELEPLFYGLMIATSRNPCDGCPIWNDKGPVCKAFQLYHTAYTHAVAVAEHAVEVATTPTNVPPGNPLFGLSVKQIAAKLEISIGEVRRRKAAGTL